MKYINQSKLLQTLMAQKTPDSKTLLADVDYEAVIQALKRSKNGLPKPVKYTTEQMEEEQRSKMSRRDKERLQNIYGRIQYTPKDVIPELLTLLQRYPNVPAIYNYLGIAYICNQQEDKHFELLFETTKRFPMYLFGKTSLAEYYLTHSEHRKVPEALDGKFELWQHYPTAEVFHVSEVRSFFCVTGSYFARANNFARALYLYHLLMDIVPDHPTAKRVGDEIILKEIDNINRVVSKNADKRNRKKK